MAGSEDPGPLAKMMLDNSDVIGDAIENFGPSAVSEFFVNVGTSIAALYEEAEVDGSKPIPVLKEEI